MFPSSRHLPPRQDIAQVLNSEAAWLDSEMNSESPPAPRPAFRSSAEVLPQSDPPTDQIATAT